KPGKLTDVEYRHIMEHPVTGARILGPLMRDAPVALAIVRSHHERLDGKGFPDGLKGDEIPLEVRIVTVADSFDAMTSLRPYRPAAPACAGSSARTSRRKSSRAGRWRSVCGPGSTARPSSSDATRGRRDPNSRRPRSPRCAAQAAT